ncbi:hypothetical protein [Streptomyces sp. NPDC088254]|uniref:hypothetical protein n=1 Tax=Streptomyces sp. NPDC088254 TaxID=3365847 RepID=UPI00380D099B
MYRTLSAAETEDLVEAVRGTARLHRYQPLHHMHHLRRTVCGGGASFVSPVLEEWIEGLGPRYGFVHGRHGVSATGVCSECVGDGQLCRAHSLSAPKGAHGARLEPCPRSDELPGKRDI